VRGWVVYSVIHVIGSLLAMQVPCIGHRAVWSCEALLPQVHPQPAIVHVCPDSRPLNTRSDGLT
jgi:hypothetical protein